MKTEHRAIMERIEQVRESRNMTKASFARAIGMSAQTYANFTGRQGSKPSIDLVLGLCRAFGVDHRWIMFGMESSE